MKLPVPFACLLSFAVPFVMMAQVSSVRLRVHVPVPAENKNVYVAGSFNSWKAGDSLYKMKKENASTYSIVLPVFKNVPYQYKYTLGQWANAEVSLNDTAVKNRTFTSTNRKKKIVDTVLKWATPKPVVKNTNPQLLKINAMKDSVLKDLQPRLAEMMQLLKAFTVNLLQQNPDAATEQKIVDDVNGHLKEIHKKLNDLFHQVFMSLSPEQKQKILQAINTPQGGKDFINTLGAAFGDVMK